MRGSIGAMLFTAALTGPALAEQGQAGFTVSVTVPVRISLEVVEQPAQLTLTAVDLARGYKDVSARYLVRHNDRNGYLLRVASRGGVVQRVDVRGFGTDVSLRDGTVDIYRPGDEFVQHIALEFHFVLNSSTDPGTFELPVHVQVTPI